MSEVLNKMQLKVLPFPPVTHSPHPNITNTPLPQQPSLWSSAFQEIWIAKNTYQGICLGVGDSVMPWKCSIDSLPNNAAIQSSTCCTYEQAGCIQASDKSWAFTKSWCYYLCDRELRQQALARCSGCNPCLQNLVHVREAPIENPWILQCNQTQQKSPDCRRDRYRYANLALQAVKHLCEPGDKACESYTHYATNSTQK